MNPESPIQIDPRSIAGIPEEGVSMVGETHCDIFGLNEGPVRFVGPVRWNFHVHSDGEDVFVSGTVSCDFEMECGRCLGAFPSTVTIDDFAFDFPVNSSEIVDLTERVREDILLDLPDYPRCDTHGGTECPAAGQFLTDDEFVPLRNAQSAESQGGKDNIWEALDALKAPSQQHQEN